ncbi:MAG: hypothetical protein KDI79_21540 [Anaerolineae bacterium]|nr:hypothetical protein [Anaerolineae bacterium]
MNRPGDETNRHAEVSLPVVRASELAQYSFCRRAWWLTTIKQIPVQSEQTLRRGRQAHARHEMQVRAAAGWRYGGFWLIGAGGLFFIIALISVWLGGG